MVGKRFGLYTVLERSPRKESHAYWICKCDCGSIRHVSGGGLRRGSIRSCGCARESWSPNKRGTTHGMARTKEYHAWQAMRSRCSNPNMPNYPRYGGRGIRVCPEWEKSFDSFFQFMGPAPSKDHSLDRYPDNDGNYEPGNCRWATATEQQNNRRCNRILTADGVSKNLSQWASDLGTKSHVLLTRLALGWSERDSVTIPVKKRKRRNGKEATEQEASGSE